MTLSRARISLVPIISARMKPSRSSKRQQAPLARMQMRIFVTLNLDGRTNYVLIAHPVLTIIDVRPFSRGSSFAYAVGARTRARTLLSRVRVEG